MTYYLLFKDGHREKIIPFLPPDILILQCEIVSRGLPVNGYLIKTTEGEYKVIERFVPNMKSEYEYFKKDESGNFIECHEIVNLVISYEDCETKTNVRKVK